MYERFAQLLTKYGVTAYKVSKDTGISRTTFSEWKSGRSTPKMDKLQKIADYFGVSFGYLMGWDEDQIEQIAEERNEVVENISAVDKVRNALQDTGYYDTEFTDDEIIDIMKYASFLILKRVEL